MSSLDGRFVIMLDHHLESPLYDDQWPVIYNDESRADAQARTQYYKVNRTEPRTDYRVRKLESKSLVYSRNGKRRPGGIYMFRSNG